MYSTPRTFLRSCSRRRGIALLLALLTVVIIATVAFTAISVVSIDTRAAVQEEEAAKAYYLARTGLNRAVRNLRVNPNYAPGSPVTETFASGLTATVTAAPAAGNAPGGVQIWTVTSVGNAPETTRTLIGFFQSTSFAQFGYFSQTEPDGGYYVTGNSFQGPAHTNGHFSFIGTPAFSDKSTTSNADEEANPSKQGFPLDTSKFNYNTAFTLLGQDAGSQTFTNPAQFYHALGGNYATTFPVAFNNSPNFSFNGGQPVIPLPANLAPMQQNASNTFTGDTTVIFNANGTATVTQSNNQVVTIPTFPTATIFVKGGNVTTSGTIHGNVTLGAGNLSTGDTTKGNINVTGSLLYSNKQQDVFGLVALNSIHVLTDPNVPANLEIDGSVMAVNGTQDVTNFSSGVFLGNLTIVGGLINNQAGFTGTANSNGNILTGYNQVFNYDPRLAATPPPNFPTTGNIGMTQSRIWEPWDIRIGAM